LYYFCLSSSVSLVFVQVTSLTPFPSLFSFQAKDVENLISHLVYTEEVDVTTIDVLAHSASCVILWNYLELFGQGRINSIVLVDQSACLIKKSDDWDDDECRTYGTLFDSPNEAWQVVQSLRSTEPYGDDENGGSNVTAGEAKSREFLRNMFTEMLSDEDFEVVFAEHMKFPRPLAAEMLWNVMTSDFRDFLPSIAVPTLCIGALHSTVPHECMSWMAEYLPNAEHEILEGSHFPFFEEPEAFNVVVDDFLKKHRKA